MENSAPVLGESLRVAVLGYGAIGSRVAEVLGRGDLPGVDLVGVITRTASRRPAPPLRSLTLADALETCDLIVETAGVAAVAQHGRDIIAAGRDLLISSVGALTDTALRHDLLGGPGRCMLTTGAVGGLDILTAASRDGGINSATITSTKRAETLVQPWMESSEADRLRTTEQALAVFEGRVTDAIASFPGSLNVAAALAAATGLWEDTRVRLIADPGVTLTTHVITAEGDAGSYEFTMTNRPLERNPTSSAVVAEAVISGIARLNNPNGHFL